MYPNTNPVGYPMHRPISSPIMYGSMDRNSMTATAHASTGMALGPTGNSGVSMIASHLHRVQHHSYNFGMIAPGQHARVHQEVVASLREIEKIWHHWMMQFPSTLPATSHTSSWETVESTKVEQSTNSQQPEMQCTQCGRTQTPEWRRGPDGNRTLCNACGLQYAKSQKKKVRKRVKKTYSSEDDD